MIILIFSGLGFYAAYFLQDERMKEIAEENDSTVNRLSSEVTYLRNIFNDLVIQSELIEKQVSELQSASVQQDIEYDDLSQKYDQLNSSYQGLLNDYRALDSSYLLERETFHNKTRVSKSHIRVFFNNVSFEYPLDMMVSLDGPHESLPTNSMQPLAGTPNDGKTVVTLSWSHVEDEPDLNATLRAVCGSISIYLNKTSMDTVVIIDDYEIRYTTCTLLVGKETEYALISTWYLSSTSYQYLCVVQQDENTVVDIFLELMAHFYQC